MTGFTRKRHVPFCQAVEVGFGFRDRRNRRKVRLNCCICYWARQRVSMQGLIRDLALQGRCSCSKGFLVQPQPSVSYHRTVHASAQASTSAHTSAQHQAAGATQRKRSRLQASTDGLSELPLVTDEVLPPVAPVTRPQYIPGRISDPNYVRIFDTTLRDGKICKKHSIFEVEEELVFVAACRHTILQHKSCTSGVLATEVAVQTTQQRAVLQ